MDILDIWQLVLKCCKCVQVDVLISNSKCQTVVTKDNAPP